MVLHCRPSSPLFYPSLLLPRDAAAASTKKVHFYSSPSRRRHKTSASLRLAVEEVTGIVHNKVLVAAFISAASGQFFKALSSASKGEGLDLKAVIRSGGMPSTHSAGVVAAATSLALERGFSDSIFGMSAVFAAAVMYDAQGVRREVGYHSKALNSLQQIQGRTVFYEDDDDLATPDAPSISDTLTPPLSASRKTEAFNPMEESLLLSNSALPSNRARTLPPDVLLVDGEDASWKSKGKREFRRFNEAAGHTKLEVIVGALLGFVVSLLVEATL